MCASRKCKAPAKQLQHFNATDCNTVGPNMLHAFGQHVGLNNVAICCVEMLRSFRRGLTKPGGKHLQLYIFPTATFAPKQAILM